MTMTIMTTSVPKIKNGMYIDFVHFFEKSSKKVVDRNGNVVPLQMYSGGENRAQRPMHKFSSADEKKSPRLERPAVSERKGEIQDNLIFNFQFSILNFQHD